MFYQYFLTLFLSWSSALLFINLSSLPDINIGSVTNPLNCLSADGSIEIQGLLGNETYTIEFEVDVVGFPSKSMAIAVQVMLSPTLASVGLAIQVEPTAI